MEEDDVTIHVGHICLCIYACATVAKNNKSMHFYNYAKAVLISIVYGKLVNFPSALVF